MTTIYEGLAIGAIYALTAAAYNLVFVTSGAINFAEAQIVMVGTFAAYVAGTTLHLAFVEAVLFSGAVGCVIAIIVERIALRTVRRRRGSAAELITTLGAAVLLDGIAEIIWGTNPLQAPYFSSNHTVTILGGRVASVDVAIFIVALCVCFGIHAWERRSTIGLAALSAAEDEDAAMLKGVNTRRLSAIGMAVAGAMLGLCGPLIVGHTYATYNLGDNLAVKAFVVMALGSFGSQLGALVGGMAVGLMESFSSFYMGIQYSDLVVFAVFVIVLLLVPAGVFGRTNERVI